MERDRDVSIDFLKGCAIILVVLGHIHPAAFIEKFIYSFHMPFFFFLSGITLWYSFERKLLDRYSLRFVLCYLYKRCVSLCLPYASWSLIWTIYNKSNVTTSLSYSFDVYWFLPTLFSIISVICTVEIIVERKMRGGTVVSLITLTVLLLFSLSYITRVKLLRQVVIYIIPCYMGLLVQKYKKKKIWFEKSSTTLICLVIFCMVFPFYQVRSNSMLSFAARFMAGIAFSQIIWSVSRRMSHEILSQRFYGKLIIVFGKSSLGIYVMQEYFRRIFSEEIIINYAIDTIVKFAASILICGICAGGIYLLSYFDIMAWLLFGKRSVNKKI